MDVGTVISIVLVVVCIICIILGETSARIRRREMEARFQREDVMRAKMQEERAKNIVIHGGYQHWDGGWRNVDTRAYAMTSPYQSVRDEFFRQTNRDASSSSRRGRIA
jgi:hypothetical protein